MATAYDEEIQFNVAQSLAVGAEQIEAAFGGGWGNGKTTALVFRALRHHDLNPGGRVALCRKTYKELEDTVMTEFYAIVPPAVIARRNDSRHICYLASPEGKQNTQVLFRHLDSRQSYNDLASLNLSFFGIDQAEEIDDEAYFTLRGRARHAGTVRESFITHNPAGHNWIWNHFHRNPDKRLIWDVDGVEGVWQTFCQYPTTKRFRTCVDAITDVNKEHLPEDYFDTLEELPDRMKERFRFASYEAYAGLVYDFNYKTHVVKPHMIPAYWPKYRILDHGQTIDPTVCIWAARDPDTGYSVYYREYVAYGRVPSENAKRIIELSFDTDGNKEIYAADIADPSIFHRSQSKNNQVSSVAIDYFDNGIAWTPAINTIDTGVQRVNERLLVRSDLFNPYTGIFGSPQCFFMSHLEYTINEMAALPWDEKTEKPDGNFPDHACDDVRYFENTVPVLQSFNPVAERYRKDRGRIRKQYAETSGALRGWMAA